MDCEGVFCFAWKYFSLFFDHPFGEENEGRRCDDRQQNVAEIILIVAGFESYVMVGFCSMIQQHERELWTSIGTPFNPLSSSLSSFNECYMSVEFTHQSVFSIKIIFRETLIPDVDSCKKFLLCLSILFPRIISISFHSHESNTDNFQIRFYFSVTSLMFNLCFLCEDDH